MKTMKQLHFDEKDFKKLENMKETAKIMSPETIANWEDFILNLAGIK